VQGRERVDLEVVVRPAGREVVGRLRGGVHDEVRALLADHRVHPVAVANVDVMVGEASSLRTQSPQVPFRVAAGTEEVSSHVVVDPVHRPAPAVEIGDEFRADEPAGSGDDRRWHGGTVAGSSERLLPKP
jgi:hypothetical protein